MSFVRFTSEFRVSALQKLTEAQGGFATVLRKGDQLSGAILLVGQIKGSDPVIYERFPELDGSFSWHPITLGVEGNDTEITKYWKSRTKSDPDLWVLELDVASKERLDGLLVAES